VRVVSSRGFRHADPRYPFLHEGSSQPPARWHAAGRGPAQCLADTPDGAWAELLRQEEITDAADLAGVERNLWAIEVDEAAEQVAEPAPSTAVLTGGVGSYAACQDEAVRLRSDGATALVAVGAGLQDGGAGGQHASGGRLVEATPRPQRTLVLFGPRPSLVGWLCCERGRPAARLLGRVRRL
jgi:hypothetical protein